MKHNAASKRYTQQSYLNINTMKAKLIPVLLLLTLAVSAAYAQETSEKKRSAKEVVQDLINDGNYVFRAQSATPMSGRVIQLTSEYDVRVSKDTVIAFLPYFGRAYAAPLDATNGGIKFTSTRFTNDISPKKKGGWDLIIKPTDVKDVQILNFSISENGYATLQVTSINRQPISFYGSISPQKVRKGRK